MSTNSRVATETKLPMAVFKAASTNALIPMPTASTQLITDQQIEQLGDNYAVELSSLSKKMLGSVKASDAEEFGEKLNQLVGVAKGLDPNKFKRKGVVGALMNLFSSTKEKMLSQYQSVETRMNTLVAELDKSASLQIQRVGDLEEMFEANQASHDGLELAVIHGREVLAVMNTQLAEMTENAKTASADSFTAQHLADFQNKTFRLEKRIDDLGRAQYLSKLAAPQIRIMQENARTLAEKFKDIKVTTIPAWQNTFSMYLVQIEQQKGAELANAVHDATDHALRLQSDLLRQNTQEIARAKQRSIVSLETVQHMQQQLLGAMDDMTRISDEGRRNRKEAEPKFIALEQELINRFTPKSQ